MKSKGILFICSEFFENRKFLSIICVISFKLDSISVLPDLRSGGGFTLVCWLDLKDSKNKVQSMIINGMSKVSGSLDEEDAEDITKGTVYIYRVSQHKLGFLN